MGSRGSYDEGRGGQRLRKMLVYVMSIAWTLARGAGRQKEKNMEKWKAKIRRRGRERPVSGLDEDGYEYLLTKQHGVACCKTLALSTVTFCEGVSVTTFTQREITGLGLQVGPVLNSCIYA